MQIPKKQENMRNPVESLYFCGLIVYIICFLGKETTWNYGNLLTLLLKALAMSFLLPSVFLAFPKYRKPKDKLLIIFVFFVSLIVGFSAGTKKDGNLLYEILSLFLLIFGAKGISFKKIVKIYLIVGGFYSVFTVLASMIGLIENHMDVAVGIDEIVGGLDRSTRMSFGYVWSTNMANHVFFIILAYIYYVGRTLKCVEIFTCVSICYFILFYTGTRLSVLCILLALLFSLLLRIKGFLVVNKMFIRLLFVYCIPIFAIISYVVTVLFDNSDMIWVLIDEALSKRLTLGNDALSEYGIPLFGQKYIMYGSVRDEGNLGVFNYLDSSFIQSLVVYGFVFSILLFIAYVSVCKKALKYGDRILLICVFLSGLSGMIAQHFLQFFMNPFLLALFADIEADKATKVT